MLELEKLNTAASSFLADDILNAAVLATKLTAGTSPFATLLFSKFSEEGRATISAQLESKAEKALARTLAVELSAGTANGTSLYDAGFFEKTKLRNRTRKLIKKLPLEGPELHRLNVLLTQDFFSEELDHEYCQLIEAIEKKGLKFRIYKVRRRLKTMWDDSYKITHPRIADGRDCTWEPTLEDAKIEIDRLADQILSGEKPITKEEAKLLETKAKAYDKIVEETAKIGKKDDANILDFIRDAVRAQISLGLDRFLLDFVLYAVTVITKPMVRCLLEKAFAQYKSFRLKRKDVEEVPNRAVVREVGQFTVAMRNLVNTRKATDDAPAPTGDIYVDEITTPEFQTWLEGLKADWRRRRTLQDQARSFLAFCRDVLHALPPEFRTPAHLVPRVKPDADKKPEPATVIRYRDLWRLLVNAQDLDSVFFIALGAWAGLHGTEIQRLEWENDIVWKDGEPVQIFIAAGNGKDKHGKRLGKHVSVLGPLKTLLKLGKGRTGRIVKRGCPHAYPMAPLVERLRIVWDQSILRHSFASNLLGIGYNFGDVAREMRNTEIVIRGHYYAPIDRPEADLYWAEIVDMAPFGSLPDYKRTWDWTVPIKNIEISDGNYIVVEEALPAHIQPGRQKRILTKRLLRIAWPDDPTFFLWLWTESRAAIARRLKCRAQTVSAHAIDIGIPGPPEGYWQKLKAGTPVTIPPEIAKALEELRAIGVKAPPPEGTAIDQHDDGNPGSSVTQ